ncbi:MAG TPA: hypothetical protein VKU00_22060 [Chthonomonadaceae bacterium]|nr:hypothetical protein [Chthonomonadaceae bacterium]
MDEMEFQTQAKADPQLQPLLEEIAREMAEMDAEAETRQFATGLEPYIGVAVYVLYRWAKDYFDKRRALNEVEIAQQQLELTGKLVAEGWPKEKAHAAVASTLKAIAKRTEDDSVLKRAQTLIGKGE